MIDKVVTIAKHHAGKTITFASVVAVLGAYTTLCKALDTRYALASEVQQAQYSLHNYIKNELEDRLLIIKLKEERNEATDIDKAMKEQYERRLHELNDKEKK